MSPIFATRWIASATFVALCCGGAALAQTTRDAAREARLGPAASGPDTPASRPAIPAPPPAASAARTTASGPAIAASRPAPPASAPSAPGPGIPASGPITTSRP